LQICFANLALMSHCMRLALQSGFALRTRRAFTGN
jgi:hypothetical protein